MANAGSLTHLSPPFSGISICANVSHRYDPLVMLRRLFTLLLAIACACAPVLTLSAAATHEADSCCCAGKCPCPPTDATAPRSASPCVTSVSPMTLEEQTVARKPAARHFRSRGLPLICAAFAPSSALRAQPVPAVAAGVALFQAHCSWRI
jgi:hypothetical protein